jgi:hypothetical protein
MLQIELDTSVCSPQLMDATGNAFASSPAVSSAPGANTAQSAATANNSAVVGDVLFDFPLSFTIHTELFLYRERFSVTGGRGTSGRSPITRDRSPGAGGGGNVAPESNQPEEPATVAAPAAAAASLSEKPDAATKPMMADSVIIRFTRTPYEFRHLLDTLAFVFPSLLLPKWPAVVLDRFPGDVLPARQAMAAFLQLTLHSLAALDDIVSHECFLSFIDHSVCPRGKYQQMKVKRHLLDEEHALGRVQQHERALHPLTANVSKNIIAAAAASASATTTAPPTGASSDESALVSRLHLDAAFLRNLMATLQAFQAECLSARLKLQKELSDRQHRRKSAAGGASTSSSGGNSSSSSGASPGSNGLLSMFSSKLLSLADLSVMVAKVGGRSLDELPPHAVAHLGDRICSSAAYGTAMTGTVSYLGPKTAGKKTDRLIGISWDEPLPFANSAASSFQQFTSDIPSSPTSPSAAVTGHWSGAAGTNGKFACRRDQGSVQRWSQVYRDPCEDVTIAAILETCVAVDRCLNPPEVGPFGTALIARNGAWVVGALTAVCHFEASVSQWCSKIMASYRTFLIAQHWISLQLQTLSSSTAAANTTPPQFDVKSIQQHVKALGAALSVGMTDFRSAWACYGAARKSNHGLVAERYVALVALFDHVEPNRFAGSWLRSRAFGGESDDTLSITSAALRAQNPPEGAVRLFPSGGSIPCSAAITVPPPSRRIGHYGKGTLDGVLMEVDAELSHLLL